MMAASKHPLLNFCQFAFALAATLCAGWGVAAWLWLQSQSRDTERPMYFAIIALCGWLAALAARRDSRLRIIVMVSLGMVAGFILGPASSASFDSRSIRLFSDPAFAFAPTKSAIGAFIFGSVGYFLPELRRLLGSKTHNKINQIPADGQSAK